MQKIVKITTFPGLLDLLCPHFCRGCGQIGAPLCDRCKNYIISQNPHNFCPNCGHENPAALPGDFASHISKGAIRRVEGHQDKISDFVAVGAERHGIISDYHVAQLPRRDASHPHARFLKYRKNAFLAAQCPFCHFPTAFVVGPRTDTLATLVHDYKYHSARALGQPLADLLSASIYEDLPKDTIVVPLPTSTRHIRERALDHTYQIARRLARSRGWRIQRLLIRQQNTVQVGSARKDRIKQAAHAYALDPAQRIDKSAHYLLLDDVWTTGASLKAALEQFRTAGVPPEHLRVALLAVSQ